MTDDVIFKQFKEMTNNELSIDETSALTHANELKNKNHNNQTPISVSAGGNKNRHKKNKNKFKHRTNNNRPTS